MIVKTQKEAAELLGITPRSLRDWRKEDGFPQPTKQGWDVSAISRWREFGEKKGSSQSLTIQEVNLELKRQQARIKKAEADKKEREEEAARGNVLDRAAWELFARESLGKVADRLMQVPKLLCKHVPKEFHLTLQAEGEKTVRKILLELKRELEHGHPDD